MRERIKKQLGSFELLPDEALPALGWAFDMIQGDRMTQLALHEELTARLSALGIETPSFSAFNRWVLRVRNGQIKRPGGRQTVVAAPSWSPSAGSRALLAAALRAIADELDGAAK